MPDTETCLFRVGYALPKRKLEAFMVKPFITYAKQHEIDFIQIDVSKSLTEQGPFECIIHKLYDHEWNLNLENFTLNYPNATIIDRPTAIQRLHNRISMLEPITQLNIPNLNIPKQILIEDIKSLNIMQTNQSGNLTFPMIAKPLLANGTTNAHNMSLVVNHDGLTKHLKLDPPFVLQHFVNHGGVVFKVYVAGEYVKCVKRSSLSDISKEMIDKIGLESNGVMSFSQISSNVMNGHDDEKFKMPKHEFLVKVANGLREALGLHLFNFDMIKDDDDDDDKISDGYLVVDVNYFPGYEKLPDYESVMVEFFLNVKRSQVEQKKMKVDDNGEKKID